MRMVYTGADEEDFLDARGRLLIELDAWSQMRQRLVDPVVVGAMLDYRFERDGLLGRWTREVLRGALLTWFPRKVVLLHPDTKSVVDAVEALLDFFEDADLLDDRTEPLPLLRSYLAEIAGEFDAAMREPANFGLAKFWAVAMAEHGVDPLDELAAQRFVERVQRGELAVDKTLLHEIAYRHYEGDPGAEPVETTPVFVLAPDDRLAADAESTLVVRRLRRFVDWLGQGRTLAEVRNLPDLVGAAKKAGVVRVFRGMLVPVKRGAPLLADPLALWRAALSYLLDDPWAFEVADELVTEPGSIPMLVELLGGGSEAILRTVRRLIDFGLVEMFPAREEHYQDLLDFAGVDSVEEVPEEERQVVRLRPLGVRAMYDARVFNGGEALTLDDLAVETAEVLLCRLAPLPSEVFDEGARLWLREREPGQAIAELSELARRTDDFEHRMLAFELLAEGGDTGIAAIRDLRDHSAAGPAALAWLLDAGLIEPSEVTGRERTYSMVDVLAAGIRSAGRKRALEEFAAQPRPAQLLFLADATICGNPRTREVLECMVVAHPDRMVSNAARKALDWLQGPDR
ncbi:hypothetical protein [Amycolatopsis taiwanensis]|uniref:hypothetical protein n=1 Tax=Amycolatopsis taiwanensis TaxID=342230 RepID=UPI0004850B08|nr:hypothetical protein [Amycolatopsis taiwanensis]